jgi:hypothetical protein
MTTTRMMKELLDFLNGMLVDPSTTTTTTINATTTDNNTRFTSIAKVGQSYCYNMD